MTVDKLPEWGAIKGLVYPERVSLEQCSSEYTAKYKANVIRRLFQRQGLPLDSFIDLTGGFGVDCYYIGKDFRHAVYVEQNAALCDIVKNNYSLLGYLHSECINDSAESFITTASKADFIYIDPPRRDRFGNRTYDIKDCTPNVKELREVLLDKARVVMIKLSPMFDWHKAVADLQNVTEVHGVSVKNECKELLLVLQNEKESLTITCANDNDLFTYINDDKVKETEKKIYPSWEDINSATYLYEPNASIMKAGCFNHVAERFGLEKISANSHLYLSDRCVDDFPGRVFNINAVSSLNRKEVKEVLYGVTNANVATRNFPVGVEDVKKRLKLKDGGDIYVFATTTDENKHIIFACKKKIM